MRKRTLILKCQFILNPLNLFSIWVCVQWRPVMDFLFVPFLTMQHLKIINIPRKHLTRLAIVLSFVFSYIVLDIKHCILIAQK